MPQRAAYSRRSIWLVFRACETACLAAQDAPPTIEDSKALLALCRAGKLYGIERWISAGKSIVTDPSLRKTALLTAVETGFHSLVELLVQHEPRHRSRRIGLSQTPSSGNGWTWLKCSSSMGPG